MDEAVHANEEDKSHYIRLQMYQLRAASVIDLAQALKEVDDEFSRRTIREMSVYKDDLIPIRVAMIRDEASFVRRPSKG